MVVSTHTTPALHFPGAVAYARLREAFTAFRAERARRARVIAELSCYTDRELLDFGISRADIPTVANGTYRDLR